MSVKDILRQRAYRILKDMLPYKYMDSYVLVKGKKIDFIQIEYFGEKINISKCKNPKPRKIKDTDNKFKASLIDIFNDFREEINELFDLDLETL